MTKAPQVIDERVYRAMALQLLALDWEKRKELLNELSVPLRTRLEIEIVRVCHDGGVRMRRHWAEQFSPTPRPGVATRVLGLLRRFRPRARRPANAGVRTDAGPNPPSNVGAKRG